MTISFPISLPTIIAAAKSTITMENSVGISESPFSFGQQVQQNQGQRWKLMLQYPAMRRAYAEQFIAAFASLSGRYGTFLAGDYDGRAPQGVATGTPLVNGNQLARATHLDTKGWTHGVTGILKAGDYIQLGAGGAARLYKNLTTVNSDGSGDATFQIWPALRADVSDGDVIVLQNTMTQFRLDTDFAWNADEVSTYGFSVQATEAL